MQLHRESEPTRRLEHLAGLGRREADPVAERVDRIHQPLGGHAGQAVLAEEVDIGVGTALELRRKGMGAEEGGGDRQRQRRAQPATDTEHARLGLAVEAVAALDLDGGDAFGLEIGDPPAGAVIERVLGRRPGRGHGRADAAPGPRDLLVAGALQAELELIRPVTAMDDMGVAIDEARRDPTAAAAPDLAGQRFRPARRSPRRPTQARRPSSTPRRHPRSRHRAHSREPSSPGGRLATGCPTCRPRLLVGSLYAR